MNPVRSIVIRLARLFKVKPLCANCPNWWRHSTMQLVRPKAPPPGSSAPAVGEVVDIDIGICRLDRPKVYNDRELGHGLKVWLAHDTCGRHPLHESKVKAGSDLEFKPMAEGYGHAGFSRPPSLIEAMQYYPARLEGTALERRLMRDATAGADADSGDAFAAGAIVGGMFAGGAGGFAAAPPTRIRYFGGGGGGGGGAGASGAVSYGAGAAYPYGDEPGAGAAPADDGSAGEQQASEPTADAPPPARE